MKRITPLFLFLSVFMLVLVLPSLVYGQDATPQVTQEATVESTGEPRPLPEGVKLVNGELPLLGTFETTFDAKADDKITLLARDTTSTVDPVLVLRDPSGKIVAQNDNHETTITGLGAYDALIENAPLAVAGTYKVQVKNNFYAEGTFELYIITNPDVKLADILDPVAEQLNVTPTPSIATSGTRTTGPCEVSVNFVSARLRQAPTVNSPQRGSLVSGQSYPVTGRVRGADGFIWYRLSNFFWVRADAVIAAGACSSVPSF